MTHPMGSSAPSTSMATEVAASGLARRLTALDRALALSSGRLDESVLADARAVCVRAGERLRLSGEHTVVALAGATGSGKSSLFNKIAGLGLSRVGVRRPTTSFALACAWGAEGVAPLLDWLGIPRQHQLSRETVLDKVAQADQNGLVLLDLPDHDSTEVEHRIEVDRLVKLVDLLIWVMDPQKYADAAVHEGYLRPLATHAAVTVVLFNQVDKLSPGATQQCLADLRRLLAEDGLGQANVLATSAETGIGLPELRRILAAQVAQKRAAGARLTADVVQAATKLAAHCGNGRVGELYRDGRDALVDGLAVAAGVPAVVDAVAAAHQHRARRATSWPLTRLVRRRRTDPLYQLQLDRPAVPAQASGPPSGASTASHIQQAQLDSALRQFAGPAADGFPDGWAASVRAVTRGAGQELPAELRRAVVETDLGMSVAPRWWRLVRWLHGLFVAVAGAGAAWLAMLAIAAFLRLPERETPTVLGLAAPTVLLFGGAVGGVLLALVCRPLVAAGARRRAWQARQRLYAGIAEVADRFVLDPVAEERQRYQQACEQIAVAATP